MTHRHRLALLVAIVAGGIALLTLSASRWADSEARTAADRAAETAAASHVGLLASELQKFRLLPLVLIEYPDVATGMRGDRPARDALNRTLELLAHDTDAAALFAIDRSGRTIAASNWRLPASFVGQNYGFRPYFADAMRHGSSELFALGTVSGRPGLYLARRVDRGGVALGVVVVKVEFDAVEASWARSAGITLVTDPHGVVLVTSLPAWRFHATGALDPATLSNARRTLQFGARAPAPAPLTLNAADALVRTPAGDVRYRVAKTGAPLAGAQLLYLSPLGPPLQAARSQALLWGLVALVVLGVGAVALLHSAERRRLRHAAHAALERAVVARTAELSDANARLRSESAERLAADRRFRAAREELAQANRLGSLGQITAGVAHEINQPVAAIRTFSENAAAFLARGARDRVAENLGHIVDLTVRIGAITAELRAFARRRTPATAAVRLGDVLDGTLLLLGERARGVLTIDIAPELRDARVTGDRIRLEQVLVNLLQNAFDAMTDQRGATVTITAATGDGAVRLHIADTGPGIDPSVRDILFTPFASAKSEGLGLGLAIARDIARAFGGDLVLADADAGATFLLTLREAA